MMPTSLEMEVRSKRSQQYPTHSEPKARRAKKKLKVVPTVAFPTLAATPTVTNLLTLTLVVLVPKDKEKALAILSMRRSPHFVTDGDETREKLMADAVHATLVIDTYQRFPKWKVQNQFQEEGSSGPIFSGVKEFPQGILFQGL